MHHLVLSRPINNNMNPNISYTTNYYMECERIPEMKIYLTNFPFPSINLSQVMQPTPFHDIAIPSDKITIDTISCEMIVDEDFVVVEKIWDWFDSIRNGAKNAGSSLSNYLSDISLFVLDNNMNEVMKILYKGCFPTNISEFQYSTQQQGTPLVCTCTFSITDMEMQRLK